jgi:hypothetical protein
MRPDAVAVQTEALRAMSVEQKLRVAESLRAFAWDIKCATIARQLPTLSRDEILQRVRAAFSNGGT